MERDFAESLVARIRQCHPGLKCVGIPEYNFLSDVDRPLIKMNLLVTRKSRFHTIQIPCRPGEEDHGAAAFLEQAREIPCIRGIMLFPVNPGLNITVFLREIGKVFPDIPLFGTLARPDDAASLDAQSGHSGSYSIGPVFIDSGCTFVVFSGEDLEIYMDYILGWKPIGKEMTITLGENRGNGESAVRLIDGQCAADVYRRYLGIEWNEYFVQNACYFPLMIRRDTTDICYIPIENHAGTLSFSGAMYDGDQIRFSYCTREDLLSDSYNGSKRMESFGAEAVMLSVCGNRITYLGTEAQVELDYYRKNNPDLTPFHGFNEISYQNGRGGVLNIALVAVGMRDSGLCTTEHATMIPIPKTRFIPTGKIPISYLISHFFSEMTKDLLHFQEHLESEIEKKTHENELLSLHVVQTLAQAIDAKDNYTNGHSARVAKYTREIARRFGLNRNQQDELYMIGLLHDVGKIGVPDEIINKTSRLTDEEYAIIKRHPVMGSAILENIREMPRLRTGARWHHERFDGRGYPDGLTGRKIPQEARIIAVADAYDAMTSNRSYRRGMTQERVRDEVVRGRGSQFDPEFADIMLSMIDEDHDFVMKEETVDEIHAGQKETTHS